MAERYQMVDAALRTCTYREMRQAGVGASDAFKAFKCLMVPRIAEAEQSWRKIEREFKLNAPGVV